MTSKIAVTRFALIAILGSPAVFAADEALPKAETILDRYVEVTGGKAAYEKRKTEVVTGTFELSAMGLKGAVVHYSAPPDKDYTSVELEGIGKIESGSADGVAWDKNAMTGPHVKTGDEKAQALRSAAFNGPLIWRKLYPKVETAGVETIDGEECYKVVLTPTDGKPITEYYQKKSGLLVKQTMTAVSQMGEIEAEARLSDYKDFDGVLTPTKTVQKAGPQEVTITIQTVKTNEPIPDDRFAPPDEIKALLKK